MKMEVRRYRILILPENEEDKAYIEDTLGLKNEGDRLDCKRVNVIGLSSIAYIKISRGEEG